MRAALAAPDEHELAPVAQHEKGAVPVVIPAGQLNCGMQRPDESSALPFGQLVAHVPVVAVALGSTRTGAAFGQLVDRSSPGPEQLSAYESRQQMLLRTLPEGQFIPPASSHVFEVVSPYAPVQAVAAVADVHALAPVGHWEHLWSPVK